MSHKEETDNYDIVIREYKKEHTLKFVKAIKNSFVISLREAKDIYQRVPVRLILNATLSKAEGIAQQLSEYSDVDVIHSKNRLAWKYVFGKAVSLYAVNVTEKPSNEPLLEFIDTSDEIITINKEDVPSIGKEVSFEKFKKRWWEDKSKEEIETILKELEEKKKFLSKELEKRNNPYWDAIPIHLGNMCPIAANGSIPELEGRALVLSYLYDWSIEKNPKLSPNYPYILIARKINK